MAAWRSAEDQADADAIAIDDVLQRLHAAITERLDREDDHAQP